MGFTELIKRLLFLCMYLILFFWITIEWWIHIVCRNLAFPQFRIPPLELMVANSGADAVWNCSEGWNVGEGICTVKESVPG